MKSTSDSTTPMSPAPHHHGAAQGSPVAVPEEPPAGLKDPVYGMTVTAQSQHNLLHEGKRVYFCSAGC